MTLAATRRGILGLFAAALPAAAVVGMPVTPARKTWKDKHVSDWTRQDCIDEAQHRVAQITVRRDAEAVGTHGRAVEQSMLDWWAAELHHLQADPGYWLEDAA